MTASGWKAPEDRSGVDFEALDVSIRRLCRDLPAPIDFGEGPHAIIPAEGHLFGQEHLVCSNPGCNITWQAWQDDHSEPCLSPQRRYSAYKCRERREEE
jgi:hypothetical protein